jgi:hypothetical protein
MGTIFIILSALLVTGIILEVSAMLMAPLGYQDEAGFHVGPEKVDDEESRLGNPS